MIGFNFICQKLSQAKQCFSNDFHQYPSCNSALSPSSHGWREAEKFLSAELFAAQEKSTVGFQLPLPVHFVFLHNLTSLNSIFTMEGELTNGMSYIFEKV